MRLAEALKYRAIFHRFVTIQCLHLHWEHKSMQCKMLFHSGNGLNCTNCENRLTNGHWDFPAQKRSLDGLLFFHVRSNGCWAVAVGRWRSKSGSLGQLVIYRGGGKRELTMGTGDENEDNAKRFISKHIHTSVCHCETRICGDNIGKRQNIYCDLGH